MRLIAAAPWAREALSRAPASAPPVVLEVARDAFEVLFRQPAHRRLERAKAMEAHLKGTGVDFLYGEDLGSGFSLRCDEGEGLGLSASFALDNPFVTFRGATVGFQRLADGRWWYTPCGDPAEEEVPIAIEAARKLLTAFPDAGLVLLVPMPSIPGILARKLVDSGFFEEVDECELEQLPGSYIL